MLISSNIHLTYCSNIHSGESWSEVFDALKKNIPSIKKSVAPGNSFGIGLRLSNCASMEILEGNNLNDFKTWLHDNDCYVFTMNGFPYGEFHNTIIKDEVYHPDWTRDERLHYTLRLIKILSALMPENSEAGISTSPVSYKLWFEEVSDTEDEFEICVENLTECVIELKSIRDKTGKYIHLDIEPEPDCLLENTNETIDFFKKFLIPFGVHELQQKLKLGESECEKILLDHINVCYDVCHFAVEFEEPETVIRKFSEAGIRIGKVQISSALKVLVDEKSNRKKILEQYSQFAESQYLHQTVVKNKYGVLIHYDDLPEALKYFEDFNSAEWRTHYHVPVYANTYNELQSTQDDILKVLEILKQNKFTNHLEVETYTWEILPKEERLEIQDSIVRELQWVIHNFEK